MQDIEEGDFIALDVSGVDVGLMGSENTLKALIKGARGFVTNGGGIRDTDEVILQKIPVWSYFVSQKMDQCRIRFDGKDVSIAIGGVTIRPGDIIVADGDGVIAVPRSAARDVAKYAHQELSNDKINRRKSYEALNWKPDETV
jgi:regulator of RNase E activity RraA